MKKTGDVDKGARFGLGFGCGLLLFALLVAGCCGGGLVVCTGEFFNSAARQATTRPAP